MLKTLMELFECVSMLLEVQLKAECLCFVCVLQAIDFEMIVLSVIMAHCDLLQEVLVVLVVVSVVLLVIAATQELSGALTLTLIFEMVGSQSAMDNVQ